MISSFQEMKKAAFVSILQATKGSLQELIWMTHIKFQINISWMFNNYFLKAHSTFWKSENCSIMLLETRCHCWQLCDNKDFNGISYTFGMFFKIGVLKNFAIFSGKHLCWSHFLKKLQAFRPATLLKRDSDTGVFLGTLRNF